MNSNFTMHMGSVTKKFVLDITGMIFSAQLYVGLLEEIPVSGVWNHMVDS